MDSPRSAFLFFGLSDDDAMRQAIRVLSSMFHVVPSEVPDTEGHVLSVEVDGAHLTLLEEVREIIAGTDPGSAELHHGDAVPQT